MIQHRVYVGDKGTVIRAMFREDIPDGSTVETEVQKPDGNVLTLPATIKDGDPPYAKYVDTIVPEFDMPGTWHFQVHIITPTWQGWADTIKVRVRERFK